MQVCVLRARARMVEVAHAATAVVVPLATALLMRSSYVCLLNFFPGAIRRTLGYASYARQCMAQGVSDALQA